MNDAEQTPVNETILRGRLWQEPRNHEKQITSFEIHAAFTSNSFFKGCVHYIFASLCLGLNKSTCQMKKNVFYFTSKPLFVLEKIKF